MIELFHEKGLLKEPADIFALTEKPEKVSKVLAEHRAALSQERRAAEGKEPVKKAKSEKEREDKVVENLMAAIERRRLCQTSVAGRADCEEDLHSAEGLDAAPDRFRCWRDRRRSRR